jgi:hypothetical protein
MTNRKVRRSQIVGPFGPGAIIDLVGESFVAEDAGNWQGRPELVDFPRLASYLGVRGLRTPRANSPLPYYRFPRWLFCTSCRRMIQWSTRQEQPDSPPICKTCRGNNQLVPMRFVAVCGNGHLADVDWRRWAHSQSKYDRNQRQCQENNLRFQSRSDVGGGLRSLELICATCDSRRSLEGLTTRIALQQIGLTCPGKQPWQMQEDARSCDEALVAMQRGASSIYFPIIVSAIDIPPESTWANVNSPKTRLLKSNNFKWLTEDPDHPLRDALLDLAAGETGLARADVQAALAAQLAHDASAAPVGSLDDIVPDEWHALAHPLTVHDSRDRFITRRADPQSAASTEPGSSITNQLNSLIKDVILVDRLREVRVLKAFERHTMKREIPSNLAPHPDYLPCVEVLGEGFFIRFSEDAVSAWEQGVAVRARSSLLAARVQQANARWLPEATPRYVLLHTLAHLLLRNTAFDAGYSTSSLRERLYVTRGSDGPAMAGILIYTAAGDTEGTLGGLVRMGEYHRLYRLFVSSVSDAQWCSFDPVCSESPGQGPRGLSLAACHACSLVPETSCVAANRLLDRRLLVDDAFGFFSPLIGSLARLPERGTG